MPLLRSTLTALLATTALSLAAGPAGAQAPQRIPPAPRVKVETTAGDFTLQLDGRRAPITTANFLRYVESGFYEGTIFHRVIPGFMAQGGGFTPALQEKPTRDAIVNESGNGLSNRRGTIAMARTNDPHSATSQFYVNLVDNTPLDPNPDRWGYAVFGRVVEGMETLDAIAEIPTGPRGPMSRDVPQTDVVIEKVTLLR